jgi:small redox-active disulfide protein 2
MDVKILGGGCKKCHLLADNTEKALLELGIVAPIEKVTQADEISQLGVLQTPALMIEGQLLVSGHVASAQKISQLIQAHIL